MKQTFKAEIAGNLDLTEDWKIRCKEIENHFKKSMNDYFKEIDKQILNKLWIFKYLPKKLLKKIFEIHILWWKRFNLYNKILKKNNFFEIK